VSQVEKRYRWVATHLSDMRTFLTKTGRFESKLMTEDEAVQKMNEDKGTRPI